MGRQRNRSQMKEQENSPEELDEMEASNLSDRVQSNDYQETQQHKKRHRNHKKGPIRNEECNIWNK